jgi:hypothetical protein
VLPAAVLFTTAALAGCTSAMSLAGIAERRRGRVGRQDQLFRGPGRCCWHAAGFLQREQALAAAAISSPLGLGSSVTEGIVFAVGRNVTEPASKGSPGATLRDTIQTSTVINPGDSGGALGSAPTQHAIGN